MKTNHVIYRLQVLSSSFTKSFYPPFLLKEGDRIEVLKEEYIVNDVRKKITGNKYVYIITADYNTSMEVEYKKVSNQLIKDGWKRERK